MLRPVQVYLSDDDRKRLTVWAKQRGWTKSQAIREAIRLATSGPMPDPILTLVGAFGGWPKDLSSRVDHYLNQSYAASRKKTRR